MRKTPVCLEGTTVSRLTTTTTPTLAFWKLAFNVHSEFAFNVHSQFAFNVHSEFAFNAQSQFARNAHSAVP